jgi:hypothetical protein
MTPPTVRLIYVDDSGSEQTGWAVYSWIECTATGWRDGLRAWLELRRRLYQEHRIPADYELHASKFIGGRGNPSLDSNWNRASTSAASPPNRPSPRSLRHLTYRSAPSTDEEPARATNMPASPKTSAAPWSTTSTTAYERPETSA